MSPEAQFEDTPIGRVPAGDGWFVLNADDAPWLHTDEFGRATNFEGQAARFAAFGFNLRVLKPGQGTAMYHAEDDQEGALVVEGEAVLLVEGLERPLRRWDYVHLPPGTPHTIVATGAARCVLVMAGARPVRNLRFPADPAAQARGVGVAEATADPGAAYADTDSQVDRGSVEG